MSTEQSELLSAAHAYVTARSAHNDAAGSALWRTAAQVVDGPTADSEMGWVEGERFSPDGIRLTIRCEREEGGVRYRERMPTSVELERAERNLKAVATDASDSELRAAALDLLAELDEPWRGCANGDPAGKAQSDARMQRHRDVLDRLRQAIWF